MMLTHCSGPRGQLWLIQLGTWIALLLVVALLPGGERPPAESGMAMATATYVGGQTCGTCHPREAERWQSSDHARAMQSANDITVLGDFDHWTGPLQNWNFMCADCHSTNLQKNYQPAEDRFETTWSDINVLSLTTIAAS
jgi:hypothetical protein